MNSKERFAKIVSAINETVTNGPLIDLQLEGATGEKVIGVLQRFALLLSNNECYLEVGVYRGKSLLAVAKAIPEKQTYGIDNFSQFDKDGKTNRSLKKEGKNTIFKTALSSMQILKTLLRILENILEEKKLVCILWMVPTITGAS